MCIGIKTLEQGNCLILIGKVITVYERQGKLGALKAVLSLS
jgi:hypothetical protein